FMPLFERTTAEGPPAWAVQRDWIREMGPEVADLDEWFRRHGRSFDVAHLFTYLYAPSALGLRAAAPYVPCLLHTTADDEVAFWLRIYDEMFAAGDAVACLTPEEAALVERRTHGRAEAHVLGLGVDTEIRGDGARFRARFDLGDDDYVLYLGR